MMMGKGVDTTGKTLKVAKPQSARSAKEKVSKMQKIALNEVCELFSGFPLGSKDFAEAGNLSVIQLRDVDRNSIRLNDLQSTDKVLATKRKLLNYGDVLFKARGPRLEAINLPLKPENTIATNGFIILRPQSQVHPSYIAWLLNNMNFGRIIQQTHVIQSISLRQLAEIEVPIPDRETQSNIVDMQREIEAGRKLANQYFDAASKILRGQIFST
ncbi:hypothetical protein GN241_14315 [Rhodobacteraceae bacterium IMCC1335]